jgi:hypothetical protein
MRLTSRSGGRGRLIVGPAREWDDVDEWAQLETKHLIFEFDFQTESNLFHSKGGLPELKILK